MEKIYEESYKNKMNKKKNNFNVSVIFSFVVAVVAIISLIVVGFNQISYSAENQQVNFTIGNKVILAKYNDKSLTVPTYFFQLGDGSSEIRPIFCIQKAVKPGVGMKYVQGNTITDGGILYILNKSKVYNSSASGILSLSDVSDESNYDYMETYATQVALWLYLADKGGAVNDLTTKISSKTTYNAETVKKIFTNATEYEIQPAPGSSSNPVESTISVSDQTGKIKNKVNRIVNEARTTNINIKSFSVSFSDKEKFEDKGDYYQTSSVTVNANPMEDLVNYTVSTSGVDGAIIVDGDGKELKGEINNNVFYVRIPKDKITDKTSEITVTVNATFNNYLEGYEYVAVENADSYQKVVTVNNIRKTISKGDSIEISSSPDTGMFKNKTILYTSIVLLLFGISIVSATIIFYKRSRLRKGN